MTLLTKRDNVKLRRKRQKLTAEKLARLKFQLTQKVKNFKQEQMEIFAGQPEKRKVEITPTLYQSE